MISEASLEPEVSVIIVTWNSGLCLDKKHRQYLRGHGEVDNGQYDQPEYVFGACGAAPLYRREMLEACRFEGEFFDETFFAHKEDLDLVWRAQLFGWKSFYMLSAVATHTRTFRPGRRERVSLEIPRHAVKNRYLPLLKNELLSTFSRHFLFILFYDLQILLYLLLFEPTSIKGVFQVIPLLPRLWRKFIMAGKKVDGAYMLGWMK